MIRLHSSLHSCQWDSAAHSADYLTNRNEALKKVSTPAASSVNRKEKNAVGARGRKSNICRHYHSSVTVPALIALVILTLLSQKLLFCQSSILKTKQTVVCKLTERLSSVTTSHIQNGPGYWWIRHLWTQMWRQKAEPKANLQNRTATC